MVLSGEDQENVNTLVIYLVIVHYFSSVNNTFILQSMVEDNIIERLVQLLWASQTRLQVCLQEVTRKA